MENTSRFESFYYNQLEPQLDTLETTRKKIVRKILITLLLFIVAFILLFVVFINEEDILIPVVTIAFIVFLITFFILKYFYTKKYYKNFKQDIISLVLNYFKKDLQYFPDQMIPQTTFMQSTIFNQKFNRYYGEDLITGTIDGIPVSFSELRVQHVTGSGKNRHTHTVFKGVFTVIQMQINHFASTTILPDRAEKLFGSKIGNFFQSMGKSRGTLVKIDNSEFEKEFVVYGTNPDSTLTLINSDFTTRLLEFRKRAGNKVYLSFIDNMAYVAVINYKNMFEARLFKKLKDINYMRKQAEYIEFFANIAVMLNTRKR